MSEMLAGMAIGSVLFVAAIVVWTQVEKYLQMKSEKGSMPKGVGDIVWIDGTAFVIRTMTHHDDGAREVVLLDRASFRRRYKR